MSFSWKEKILNFLYYSFVRPSRLKRIAPYLNALSGRTILDVGYCDSMLRDRFLRSDFEYCGIDPNPRVAIPGMPRAGIEEFKADKQFDIVLATEVLEHTKDPVAAMRKIKTAASRFVGVSVPYEPFYTLYRFCVPVQDHYFAISPAILRHYFGEPVLERRLHFGRTYFAIYDVSKKETHSL